MFYLPGSESRMLRTEAILSAVAGLSVSWSSSFSREPSSPTNRSISATQHTNDQINMLIDVCVLSLGCLLGFSLGSSASNHSPKTFVYVNANGCLCLCVPVTNQQLVQSDTLHSLSDSWEGLQLNFVTLSSGSNRYQK